MLINKNLEFYQQRLNKYKQNNELKFINKNLFKK